MAMTETMKPGSKLTSDIRAVAECRQRLEDTVGGVAPAQSVGSTSR
jgi:hypothetical protein